jgi:hypothetical protein
MLGFLIYITNSIIISYGQVSNLLLLLIAGSWIAGRNHRETLSGILIGMACAIKIFCGLFLIYFLISKQYKAFFSAILSGFMIFIGTIILFGFKSYLYYFQTLTHISWYGESWSISFKSFFIRLFSPTEKNIVLYNAPHLAQFLTLFFSALLLTALVFTWHKLRQHKYHFLKSTYYDTGFSLTLISMLLLSPLGWNYYFNLLIIPYLILIHESKDDRIHLLCCVLLFINSLAGDLIKTFNIKNAAHILINGGLSFYAIIIFLLLFFRLAYQKMSAHHQSISPLLWSAVYFAAFIPSLLSQGAVIKNMINLYTGFA